MLGLFYGVGTSDPSGNVKLMATSSIDEIIAIYKKDVDVTLIDECLRRTVPERMWALQAALTAIEELREQVAKAKAQTI